MLTDRIYFDVNDETVMEKWTMIDVETANSLREEQNQWFEENKP